MENPETQPQYFRFENEGPQQAPKQTPWRPEVIKRLALIGAGILVLIFGGVFLSNVVKNISSGGAKSALEATQSEIVQRQADCNAEDEVCKNQAQTNVARASGIAEACDGLEDGLLQNCVTLIAREKKDSEACGILSGKDRVTCEDAVLLARAGSGEGMAICSAIQSASKKNSCQALVTSTARLTGDCVKYGVDEEICTTQKTREALLAEGNFAGCAELPEDDRIMCIELFSSIDGDLDGLTAQEEAEIGTSDANPDTDGDGYDDRTEQEAGYNPLN